jgi:hypothetical protein
MTSQAPYTSLQSYVEKGPTNVYIGTTLSLCPSFLLLLYAPIHRSLGDHRTKTLGAGLDCSEKSTLSFRTLCPLGTQNQGYKERYGSFLRIVFFDA